MLGVRFGTRHVTNRLREMTLRDAVNMGHESATFTFDAPVLDVIPEVDTYAPVTVFDEAARSVWEGEMTAPGRSVNLDGQSRSITAVGGGARLDDHEIPLHYVVRGMPDYVRLSSSRPTWSDSPDTVGADLPAVRMVVPRGTVVAADQAVRVQIRTIKEAGQKLAYVDAIGSIGNSVADWRWRVIASPSETIIRSVAFALGNVASDPKVVGADFTNGDNEIGLQVRRVTSGITVADDSTAATFADLILVAMRYDADGVEITTGYGPTVTATDVVNDLVGRLLGGGITAHAVDFTFYDIDHLSYPDGVTAARLMADIVEGIEPDHYWTVRERDPSSGLFRLRFARWPSTIRYECAVDGGLDAPGQSAELYTGVNVRWREGNQIRYTSAVQTVPALGARTRSRILDLGDEVGSAAGAAQAGAAFLAEHASVPNGGVLTVPDRLYDRYLGCFVQGYRVEPGNLILVRGIAPHADDLNASARNGSTIFRIVGKEYSMSDGVTRVDLDSRPKRVSTIIDKLRKDAARSRRR